MLWYRKAAEQGDVFITVTGSRRAIALAIPLACSKRMCGGSGGTSGSLMTSSSAGRPAFRHSSQAAPTASGSSTRTPCSPISRA